jgi:hypothetical protein
MFSSAAVHVNKVMIKMTIKGVIKFTSRYIRHTWHDYRLCNSGEKLTSHESDVELKVTCTVDVYVFQLVAQR